MSRPALVPRTRPARLHPGAATIAAPRAPPAVPLGPASRQRESSDERREMADSAQQLALPGQGGGVQRAVYGCRQVGRHSRATDAIRDRAAARSSGQLICSAARTASPSSRSGRWATSFVSGSA